MTRFTCVATFLLSLMTSPGSSQQSSQAEPGNPIRITVGLVQIDAVVTDSKGRHVTDLRPQDFEILEDGRPQQITHFSYLHNQAPAPSATGKPPQGSATAPAARFPIRREEVRRTIALIVDDLGLSYTSLNDVKRSLGKFLNEQMQPGDIVAILRTSGGAGSLQQFTSDRRILAAAIDRLHWVLGRGDLDPAESLDSDVLTDPAGDRGGRKPDAARIEQEQLRHELLSIGSLGAIRAIIGGLEDLPGRKSVILFSDGFAIWLKNQEQRELDASVQKLIDQANRSSVVLYAIDARGIQSLVPSASEAMDNDELEKRIDRRMTNFIFSQGFISNLARQTGGFAIVNRNDISWGIGRVLEDLSGSYLIGYKPDIATFTPGGDGPKYHKIAVKLKVPGLRVRSRSGFYGVPSQAALASTRSPEEQLTAALRSPFGSSGIRLRLTSLYTNNAQGSVLRNLLHLDANDLSFTDDGGEKVANIEIAAAAQSESGEPAGRELATSELRVRNADFESTLATGLLYEFDLPTSKSGAYQMRIAVRDSADGKIGSAGQFIETPDVENGAFALSGIYLGAEADAGEKNETAVIRHAALRTFHPGQTLSFSFQIYNAAATTALVARLLLWRDGKPLLKGEPAPLKPADSKDPKRLLATGSLRLSPAIPFGAYVLQIVASDNAAKKKIAAGQSIDFEITP